MAAGERRLGKIQILMEESSDIKAIEATIEEGGTMSILFDNGEKCIYAPEMLAAFATSAAAKHISGPTIRNKDVEWVKPFTGVPDAPAPSTINHWRGQTGGGEIPAMQWTDVMTPEGNLEMLKHLLAGHGAVRVVTKGMSEAGVTTLLRFSDFTCNGLQKDPSRAEANWLIVRKENAASVSYNPSTRLNNHSDQSLPNYGIPALLLVFHYAEGWGANIHLTISNIDKSEDNYMDGNELVFQKFKTAKSKGIQRIKIPITLKNILKKWKNKNPTDYLLFNNKMKPLTSATMTQKFNRLFGNRNISINNLRSSYLSHKYQDTIQMRENLENDMDLMGSSLNMSNTYIKR